jgi:hypothetical protein
MKNIMAPSTPSTSQGKLECASINTIDGKGAGAGGFGAVTTKSVAEIKGAWTSFSSDIVQLKPSSFSTHVGISRTCKTTISVLDSDATHTGCIFNLVI